MSEMKFDEARIAAWKREIDAEFDAVEIILRDVSEEVRRDPIEGDPVLEGIYNAGTKLEEAWGKLKTVFHEVSELADSLFSKTKKAIGEVRDNLMVS